MYINITKYAPQNNKGVCSVEIEWKYGNQIPDIIEIYAHLNGSDNGLNDKIKTIDVKKDNNPVSINQTLLCASYYIIDVCPRMLTDGVIQDQQPDDNGDLQYWETFAVSFSITTSQTSSPSPNPDLPVPVISSIVPIAATLNNGNRLSVYFTSSKPYDKYLIRWVLNNGDTPMQVDTNASPCLVGTDPSRIYIVSIKGGVNLDIDWKYSEWSAGTIVQSATLSRSARYFFQEVNYSLGIKKYMKGNSLKKIMGL